MTRKTNHTPVRNTQMKQIEMHIAGLLYGCDRQALCDAVGVTQGEMCRKISGDAGWTLPQLSAAFNVVGINIIGPDQIAVNKEQYRSMEVLIANSFKEKVEASN